MIPRVTSDFWVGAYLRRLSMFNIPAFVVSKGDLTAGAIFVKLNTLDGKAALYQRTYDTDGRRPWMILSEGDETEVDAVLDRQRGFDPDLWVIEVEDRAGRHLLDDDGLAS
jgi:hypothetical protein